jgi:hypothetical protein
VKREEEKGYNEKDIIKKGLMRYHKQLKDASRKSQQRFDPGDQPEPEVGAHYSRLTP